MPASDSIAARQLAARLSPHTPAEHDKILADCKATLNDQQTPTHPETSLPLNSMSPSIQTVSASPEAIAKTLHQLNVGSPRNSVDRATFMAALPDHERRNFISAVLNTTTTVTIDSALKRVAILNETIRAFATRILPLRLFATAFQNVPLQGTDEIVVPYYPLQTATSTDWNAADGYAFADTVTSSMKKITVNKRKYQSVDFGSDTLRRQPAFNAARLGTMNAEKLAVDVINDVLSAVTASAFGSAALTCAAAAITSDDIATLAGACNAAHWPDAGRGLIVDSAVNTALMKDESYKLAVNIGGTEVVRGGRLPMLSGFEYAWMPSLPTNSEKLIGFACFMSGILAAFCPVEPSPEVRNALSAYEIVTDPASGISLNYRAWGDADLDRSKQVIECAYGYVAGEAAAIKRICTP